jgi:hypothetical protein
MPEIHLPGRKKAGIAIAPPGRIESSSAFIVNLTGRRVNVAFKRRNVYRL